MLLGNVVNASQSWRVPLLQVSLTFPPTIAQTLWGRSHCSILSGYLPQGKKVDKSDEMGFGTYGDIQIFCKQKNVKAVWQGSPSQAGSGKPLEGYLLPGTSLMAGLLNL